MIDKDFKTKIKTFSNKELLEQIDFMTEGYYSDLIEICLEELRCRLEATRWHYPSKGEYPQNDKWVFVYLNDDTATVGLYCSYTELKWIDNYENKIYENEIVAWQYIIPPKEK